MENIQPVDIAPRAHSHYTESAAENEREDATRGDKSVSASLRCRVEKGKGIYPTARAAHHPERKISHMSTTAPKSY